MSYPGNVCEFCSQISGSLYQLDGGAGGPILCGETNPKNLLEDAVGSCQEYMNRLEIDRENRSNNKETHVQCSGMRTRYSFRSWLSPLLNKYFEGKSNHHNLRSINVFYTMSLINCLKVENINCWVSQK